MAILYNPGNMTDEERKETFVGRETIVQELIGIIEHQPEGAGIQHAILIGPRGIGKTSILLTLRHKLEDSGLIDKWQAVIFPEESYGIYDLADFWIEVLKLLAGQTKNNSLYESAESFQKDFSDKDDPAEAAIALIKDWCTKNKKRLLLFAENFDMILGQIHDARQDAQLRSVLMNDGTFMILGTGISFFEQTRSYDKPLYNFFRIFDVDNLSFEQSKSLLLKRAAFDKIENFEENFSDGKLKSLQYFTGGNPRLLLMLYHVISGSPPEEIRIGLEKLLDEVTPYYKNKTEILPPQQRKILDHLARTGAETREGVSPTDIAKTTRMKPNIVSSQLKRLSSQGYVRSADIRGRASYYSLSEPLYSIWYQMRFGREAQRHMEWLVNFLKNWYDEPGIDAELSRIKEKFNECLCSGMLENVRKILNHEEYLVEAISDKINRRKAQGELLQQYFKIGDFEKVAELAGSANLVNLTDDDLKTMDQKNIMRYKVNFHLGMRNINRDKYEDALSFFNAAVGIDSNSSDAWYLHALTLCLLDRESEALSSFEKALHIKSGFYEALTSYGFTLWDLKRYEEALSNLKKAIQLKPDGYDALMHQGKIFKELGRNDEALVSFNLVIDHKPADCESWSARAQCLQELGRFDEAIASFDKALQLDARAGQVWSLRSVTLSTLNKFDEAISSIDKAISIKPGYESFWRIKGLISACAEKFEEAINSFDRALAINPDIKDSWSYRTEVLLLWISRELNASPDLWKIKSHFQEALKSRPIIGPGAWDKLALPILLPLTASKNADLLLQLFTVPELEQEFFPLIRALEFFKTRDRDIIEKLSPEYRGIVLEIIEKYDNQQKQEEPESIEDDSSQD